MTFYSFDVTCGGFLVFLMINIAFSVPQQVRVTLLLSWSSISNFNIQKRRGIRLQQVPDSKWNKASRSL